MRDLQDVLDAAQEVESGGKAAILATVVEVEGSAYRRPGARMLITEEGWCAGGISGGCLEADLADRAWRLTEQGTPSLVTYDTTPEADLVLGLGLGCRGVVRVLVERLVPGRMADSVAFLRDCLQHRGRGVMATVFRQEGTIETTIGARLFLDHEGHVRSDIRDAGLAERVREDAWLCLASRRSETKVYTLPVGAATVFMEVIELPVPLVIFGAGHDAVPVVRIAKEIGWHVTVVDSRPAYASSGRFPSADAVVLSRPETTRERIRLDADTVALVMTHNYLQDRKLLALLLPSPARYLGVLGPKQRTDRLLLDLTQDGIAWSDAHASRLYAPVGLDIGANTPESIALAILAEIQAVLADRPAGFLRERRRAIHHDSGPEEAPHWQTTWTGTPSNCGMSAS